MFINKKCFGILLLTPLFVSACSLLPVSKEARNILNEAKDLIFEEERFNLKDAPNLDDGKIAKYSQKTLDQILEHNTDVEAIIEAADAYEAQGMCTDDGIIYISKGMLYSIKNEAEFVAILGHEVGHLKLKHLDSEHQYKSEQTREIIQNAIKSATGIPVSEDAESEFEEVYQSQFSQKNEQEADEFGALTAHRMGYDPYAFVELLRRLDQMADKGITENLKRALGTHKTLATRANHVEQYLNSKGIKRSGHLKSEEYLKNVSHLGVEKSKVASQQVDSIYRDIESRALKKQSLTIDEFLSYMRRIRSVAEDLSLLSQLASDNQDILKSTDEFFMMESVKVLTPWWAPSSENFEKLKESLALLSRIGINAIPYVGDAIDLYELLVGKDFLTDKELSFGERVASALGVFAGSGKYWRSAEKDLENLGKISKIADEDEVSAAAKAAKEAINEAPIFKRTANEKVKDLQKRYRPIKNKENYEKLKELSEAIHEKKLPDDWRVKASRIDKAEGKHQGLEFIHPENDHIRVRVMPGNPNAEWSSSRKPYVQQKAHGKYIDQHGRIVDKESEGAHIPLTGYEFKDFWSAYGKK